MLAFYVINLVIPGDPASATLTLPYGSWTLTRIPNFPAQKEALSKGMCAETYILEHDAAANSSASEVALQELTPILLSLSYLTGRSVTIQRSNLTSEVMIAQPSEHWPRARGLISSCPVVDSSTDLTTAVETFVQAWPTKGQSEKARLLIHQWLDAAACWSLEDLYLSATTLLQIVCATEAARIGKSDLPFREGVNKAGARFGVRALSDDFKNMRNELIHSGQLIGARFAGPDKAACAVVAGDVLNWFDEYLHAALGLGSPRKTRFQKSDFMGLNGYSIN